MCQISSTYYRRSSASVIADECEDKVNETLIGNDYDKGCSKGMRMEQDLSPFLRIHENL